MNAELFVGLTGEATVGLDRPLPGRGNRHSKRFGPGRSNAGGSNVPPATGVRG